MSMTVADPTQTVASIKDKLTAIDQEIEGLRALRYRAFIEERDDWRRRGFEAHIVANGATTRDKVQTRHFVNVHEFISNRWTKDGTYQRSPHYRPVYVGDEPEREWGPYLRNDFVWIQKGEFTVTLADDELVVIAQLRKRGPDADQFTKAIGRLRSLARREHMKISVRDRAITIKSPMNDVVHEGDVFSAFFWLAGIDESALKYHRFNFEENDQ